MKNDIVFLKTKFNEIKKMGWIKSEKSGSGAIGIMFENLLGLNENEFEIPDFGSIEIKTKSKSKYTHINLFNCAPTGPHYHEVENIKDSFGYPDSEFKNFKVFNGDVFCNKLTKIGNTFYFKLNVYREKNKITLNVYDKKKNKIEESTYWDFDILEEKLNRKLTYLAFIDADKKFIHNQIYFKYNSINFYRLKNFYTFIYLLEHGVIKIEFKLGIFKDKKRLGKIHDRGTSFSIDKKDIDKLFYHIK